MLVSTNQRYIKSNQKTVPTEIQGLKGTPMSLKIKSNLIKPVQFQTQLNQAISFNFPNRIQQRAIEMNGNTRNQTRL